MRASARLNSTLRLSLSLLTVSSSSCSLSTLIWVVCTTAWRLAYSCCCLSSLAYVQHTICHLCCVYNLSHTIQLYCVYNCLEIGVQLLLSFLIGLCTTTIHLCCVYKLSHTIHLYCVYNCLEVGIQLLLSFLIGLCTTYNTPVLCVQLVTYNTPVLCTYEHTPLTLTLISE